MNILLTGQPHSGKSTLLNTLVTSVEHRQGFVTNEVLHDGERTGFELVSAVGNRAPLASVNSSSIVRVSKYGVELDTFDQFLSHLPGPTQQDLLYIDEIGRMELYSEKFKDLVRYYLALPNPFVGTITSVYDDEFTNWVRSQQDVEIFEITHDNRNSLSSELAARIKAMAQ